MDDEGSVRCNTNVTTAGRLSIYALHFGLQLSARGIATATATAITATAPPPTTGIATGVCVDDADCSLNGACTVATGTCVCRAPWTGSDCHLLQFKPATFPLGYGMAPNRTTWGGGAIFEAPAKLFHLYVSTMTNDCPLQRWQTNFRIDHVVSEHPTGSYRFRDVAVPTWAHNSAPVTLPGGTFAIFHLGNASSSANGGHNCTEEYQHPSREWPPSPTLRPIDGH